MKKKDGFTLIELLAVIVILAIIALIVNPIILNIINDARKGAAQNSAYGIRNAAKLYYQTSLLYEVDNAATTITFDKNSGGVGKIASVNIGGREVSDLNEIEKIGFNIEGTIPTSGVLEVASSGDVRSLQDLEINGLSCNIPNSGKITCEKVFINYQLSSPNEWTLSKELTIKYDKACNVKKYSDDNGITWKDYSDELLITENKVIKAQCIDSNNNEYTKNIVIDKIDNAPMSFGENPFTINPATKTIKIIVNSVNVGPSGVKEYTYSLDNNPYSNAQSSNIITIPNVSSGSHTIKIKVCNNVNSCIESDILNTATITLEEPLIEYSADGGVTWSSNETPWARERMIRLTYNENMTYRRYKIGENGIFQEYTQPFIVNENGVVVVEYGVNEDEKSSSTINESKIDRVIPNISASSQGINVTLTMSDDNSGLNSYCITNANDSGTCTFISNSSTNVETMVASEGIYYAFSKDNAGNISNGYEFEASELAAVLSASVGDIVRFSGYNWHVIGDDTTNDRLYLLLDGFTDNDAPYTRQINNMSHCSSVTDSSNNCRVDGTQVIYSWENSLIRTYLNSTFYNSLSASVKAKIVLQEVCKDESIGRGFGTSSPISYGGYTKSEIDSFDSALCTSGYTSDYVRLMTASEYHNLSQYFTTQKSQYPIVNQNSYIPIIVDVPYITRISTNNWLYAGGFWLMSATSPYRGYHVDHSSVADSYGNLITLGSATVASVRPVIVLQK